MNAHVIQVLLSLIVVPLLHLGSAPTTIQAQPSVHTDQAETAVKQDLRSAQADSLIEWLDLLVIEQDQGLGYVSAKRKQAKLWVHKGELYDVLGFHLPEDRSTWILLDSVVHLTKIRLTPDFFRMTLDLAEGSLYPAKALREAQRRHTMQSRSASSTPTYLSSSNPHTSLLNAIGLNATVHPLPRWQGSGYLQSTSTILKGTYYSGIAFPLSTGQQGSVWRSTYNYWQWESSKQRASRPLLQVGHIPGSIEYPYALYGIMVSNRAPFGDLDRYSIPIRGIARPGSIVEGKSPYPQDRHSVQVDDDSSYVFWLPVRYGINRMALQITEAGSLPRELTRTILLPDQMSAHKVLNYAFQLGKNPYRLSDSHLSGYLSYGIHPLWNLYLTSQAALTPEGKTSRWSGGFKTSIVNVGWVDLAVEHPHFMRIHAVLQRHDRFGINYRQYRLHPGPLVLGSGATDIRTVTMHGHVGNQISFQSQYSLEQSTNFSHQHIHFQLHTWWNKWALAGFVLERMQQYDTHRWNRYGSLGASLTYALKPEFHVNVHYAGRAHHPKVDHQLQLAVQWRRADHHLFAHLAYSGPNTGLESFVGIRTALKHAQVQQSLHHTGHHFNTYTQLETTWLRSSDKQWEYTNQGVHRTTSIKLIAFHDMNGDGQRNNNESVQNDLTVSSTQGSLSYNIQRGHTLISGLMPNRRYEITLSNSILPSGLVVRYPSIQVTSPVSGIKTYEIPMDKAIELEGNWMQASQQSLLHPQIILTHTRTGISTHLVLMQDGSWYHPGVPLGGYHVRLATNQADNWEVYPAYIEVTDHTRLNHTKLLQASPITFILKKRDKQKVQGTEDQDWRR